MTPEAWIIIIVDRKYWHEDVWKLSNAEIECKFRNPAICSIASVSLNSKSLSNESNWRYNYLHMQFCLHFKIIIFLFMELSSQEMRLSNKNKIKEA